MCARVVPGSADAASGPAVFVEVVDDGAGLREPRAGGRGLRNMHERAARIGARLDIESRGAGTTVRLSLPLAAAA